MNDIRIAFRLCRRYPVLSLAAILSLALGIGANTAIFSVLHGSILRPLPYAAPDRLVAVWETSPTNSHRTLAPANFLDWRRSTTAFAGLASFTNVSGTLTGTGETQSLRATSAAANFFDVLGVKAAVGRTMTESDDRPGGTPVAVLKDGLARRLFGAPEAAVGKSLVVDGLAYSVVGVLSPSFDMPMAGDREIWLSGEAGLPRLAFPGGLANVRDAHFIKAIGRLAEGHSREEAEAQINSVMAALSQQYPATNAGLGGQVTMLQEEIVGNVRPLILLLQGAVALLLLIACANVAHLLLGQAAARQTEVATRLALGAGRGRIVQQFLAETLVIAIPGGIAGVVLAMAGIRALVLAAPASLPRLGEVTLDGGVLAFACATTIAASVVFGLIPAFHATNASERSLSPGARGVAGARGVRRWHHGLAIGELALAQLLLVGAALLVVSFVNATRVTLGFETDGRVAAEMNLTGQYVKTIADSGRIDPSKKIRFIEQVIDRVSQEHGVHAVGAGFFPPLGDPPSRSVRIEGEPEPPPNQQLDAVFQIVTPGYFRASGMTMVAGRSFLDTDRAGAPGAAIVNEAFARQHLAGRSPIGRVLTFNGAHRHEIVGVVADARLGSVERPADPAFYVPLGQNDERWGSVAFIAWSDAPADASSALVAAIHEADPQQPISRVRTFDDILSRSLAPRRFNTWLVGLFAATALLLAAIGTYGVMALAVASRTRELGVRAALGASPGNLVRMVLGEGLALTTTATVLGLAAALGVTRFMSSMLFGIAPRDPWTFAVVAVVLTIVAVMATWWPARRAMRVNPIVALRDT